jgi:hypothetical protein
MILSKELLAKIKTIIDRNYNAFIINVLGQKVFTDDELDALKNEGIDTDNPDSLISLIYYHNVINDPDSVTAPTSVPEMKRQQKATPIDEHHAVAEEHLNETVKSHIEKLKSDNKTKFEGLFREYNLLGRNKVLETGELTETLKQDSVQKIKQTLRDLSGDANRNWTRIAVTEVSNAIGLGSVDRLVSMNKDKDFSEVYVYRIPVIDAALCKKCREFYLDADESPAVYRMATILGNGTNYGKKQIDWKPVAGATHVNDRESGLIELRRGWKLKSGGQLDFIGYEKWDDYIKSKVRS